MGYCLIVLCFSTFVLLPTISSLEQLCVTEAPPEVKFTTTESLRSAYLADVFSALFGYTIPKSLKWRGLAPVNPLMKPEALIVMEISGLGNYDFQLDGTCFTLENEGDVSVAYEILAQRTKERYPNKKPVVMNIPAAHELHFLKAEHPNLLKGIPADPEVRLKQVYQDSELRILLTEGSFNVSESSDRQFLLELGTVRSILHSLPKFKADLEDGVPDIYWFQLKSLPSLMRDHSQESFAASEALRMLKQIINEVSTTFQKVYDWQAVIAVISPNEDPAPLESRRSRSLLASPEQTEEQKLNLAPEWSSQFPVSFSIIAFVVVFFALSLLGISVAMWHMDPGRDSIIYRMTSQRMKKD